MISIRPLLIHGEMLGRLDFTNIGMTSIRPLLDPSARLYNQGDYTHQTPLKSIRPPSYLETYWKVLGRFLYYHGDDLHRTPTRFSVPLLHGKMMGRLSFMGIMPIRPLLAQTDPSLTMTKKRTTI